MNDVNINECSYYGYAGYMTETGLIRISPIVERFRMLSEKKNLMTYEEAKEAIESTWYCVRDVSREEACDYLDLLNNMDVIREAEGELSETYEKEKELKKLVSRDRLRSVIRNIISGIENDENSQYTKSTIWDAVLDAVCSVNSASKQRVADYIDELNQVENLKKKICSLIREEYRYSMGDDDESICIDVDYRDELSACTIKQILDADDPEMEFEDLLNKWATDYAFDYGYDTLIEYVEKNLTNDELELYESRKEEIRDEITGTFCFYYRKEDWNRDVKVNIMVDTGNCNYDFTCDNILNWYGVDGGYCSDGEMDDLSSMLWLARQQGKENELKKQVKAVYDYLTDEDPEHSYLSRPKADGFVESCIQEMENLPSHMGTMTFLVKMKLLDLLKLKSMITMEKELNEKNGTTYSPLSDRVGMGYIVLDKSVMCGLFDSWYGSGSVLGVECEKDVKIPVNAIFDACVDGTKEHGFDVDDVYGLIESAWRDALKEKHYMTPEEIAKAGKVPA